MKEMDLRLFKQACLTVRHGPLDPAGTAHMGSDSLLKANSLQQKYLPFFLSAKLIYRSHHLTLFVLLQRI